MTLPIDVHSLITDIGVQETVTRERPQALSSIDELGNIVTPSNASASIVIGWHQASPQTLQRLGLDFQQDHRQIYSEFSLAVRDVLVFADATRWEIQTAEDYYHVGGLYSAIAQRTDP